VNPLLRFLIAFVPFVGVTGLVIATVIGLIVGVDDFDRVLLENSITFLIGVTGLMAGFGHMFFPDPIADSIGWPKGTPWQWEVGLASVSVGVLGVIATSYDTDFWLATIIAFSVYYIGAAIGHVRQMIAHRNFSAGNAGPIFLFDVVVPIYLIVLYAAVV